MDRWSGRKQACIYLQLGEHLHWAIDGHKYIAGIVDDNEKWGKEEENSVGKSRERPSEEVEGGEEQCRDPRSHPFGSVFGCAGILIMGSITKSTITNSKGRGSFKEQAHPIQTCQYLIFR